MCLDPLAQRPGSGAIGGQRRIISPTLVEAHLKARGNADDLDVALFPTSASEVDGNRRRAGARRRTLIDGDQGVPVRQFRQFVGRRTDRFAIKRAGVRCGTMTRMDALMLLVQLARATPIITGRGDFHLDAHRADPGAAKARSSRAVRVLDGHSDPVAAIDRRLAAGAVFSTNLFWDRANANPGRAYGAVPHQGLWFDVGTPGAIPKAEAMLADE